MFCWHNKKQTLLRYKIFFILLCALQAPFIFSQESYSGFLRSLSYNSSGTYLAKSSKSSDVTVWDTKSGRVVNTLSGHTLSVRSVCFSPKEDGTLASGSADDTIKLWNIETGECRTTLKGHLNSVVSLSYSPDGTYLVSGSIDKTVKLWQPENGSNTATYTGHTERVNSVCFSPAGTYLASGASDKTVIIWDINSGTAVHTLTGHTQAVTSVSFSPDGAFLASGSTDKTVIIWNTKDGSIRGILKEHSGAVTSVSFSYNGKYLASCSFDGIIKIWNTETGMCIKTAEGHSGWLYGLSCSPVSEQLAFCSFDGTVKLFNMRRGSIEKNLERVFTAESAYECSPAGDLIAGIGKNGSVEIWDSNHNSTRILNGINKSGTEPYTIASNEWSKIIKIWDSETCLRTKLLEPDGNTATIRAVAFSHDGKYIAGSSGCTVKTWNAETGNLMGVTINFKNNEWVSYTPEGFFAGTEAAIKSMVYIKNYTIISIEQLYNILYRPDLVAAKLRGEDISGYTGGKTLNTLLKTAKAPPLVDFTVEEAADSGRKRVITGSVKDLGGGIGAVYLVVNGKNTQLNLDTGKTDSSGAYQFFHTISLQNGENTVELYAFNAENSIESRRLSKKISWHGDTEKPKLYIFTAAIHQYKNQPLKIQINTDIIYLADEMEGSRNDVYSDILSITLSDHEVTKERINAVFTDLKDTITADDIFIFCASGYETIYNDGDYYYLPADFFSRSDSSIPQAALSKTDILQFISQITCAKMFVLFDTYNPKEQINGTNVLPLSRKTGLDRLMHSIGCTIVTDTQEQALHGRSQLLAYMLLTQLLKGGM